MKNSQEYKKPVYPTDFTEEDKLNYDKYKAEAKIIHPNTPDFITHISIISYIRLQKGEGEPFTNEELEELKESYKIKQTEFSFDSSNYPDLYDKTKNPIYFNEEKLDEYFKMERLLNSNIILEKTINESNAV